MRIGVLAPAWVPVPPPKYGGTESVIDRLARGFDTAGNEVLLWATGDSTCPVRSGFVYDQAQIERIGSASVEMHHVIRGYDAFVAWGADVVHDHTLIGPVYSQRLPQFKVVTTNHGPFNDELADLYREIAGEVAVIAISADQASRARDIPLAAVIHHGIDVDNIQVGEGDGDETGTYLLFLGRMIAEKGVADAARVARRTGRRLIIAAKMLESVERRYFHDQVEPLLSDDIVYVGEATNDEKFRLLRGATALINPIRWPEPFGLVMVEALACGTPVISFDAGAAPEIVRDGVTGFVCRDIDEMVDRMGKLDSIDRSACRLDAEMRFTTARMVDAHLDLFERLTGDVDLRLAGAGL